MGVPAELIMRDGEAASCEATISRFRRTYRRRLRKLARLSDPLADLVTSFPAAAFAIVTEFGTVGRRSEAIRLVKTGASLKLVAKALGLPLWLRKLPPEAFARPLPDRLPSDPQFGARITGLVPGDLRLAAGWLDGVVDGWTICDDAFAHWVARNPEVSPSHAHPDGLALIGLYAWFSGRPETAGGKLLPARWNADMSPGRACRHAAQWATAVHRELVLGQNGLAETWLAGGRAASYRIVPIASMADLREEAQTMSNCVMDYAPALAKGDCRLFSIRRGGLRVATVEVQRHTVHERIPLIVQLRGPDNSEVSDRVWQAVFVWLSKQASFDLPDYGQDATALADEQTWQQVWRPYWREKGSHILLPEKPDRAALARLANAAQDVARRR